MGERALEKSIKGTSFLIGKVEVGVFGGSASGYLGLRDEYRALTLTGNYVNIEMWDDVIFNQILHTLKFFEPKVQ
ncbi:MAG: hypothetical protein Q8L47_05465 [bacterium]|nr:hypothetical protein [bacterium]